MRPTVGWRRPNGPEERRERVRRDGVPCRSRPTCGGDVWREEGKDDTITGGIGKYGEVLEGELCAFVE
jgi:hypothetical protein